MSMVNMIVMHLCLSVFMAFRCHWLVLLPSPSSASALLQSPSVQSQMDKERLLA